LWVPLVALLCASVTVVVWFSITLYRQHHPVAASPTASPPVAAPSVQAAPPPVAPPPPAIMPSPAPAPAPKPALPVAIEGSACRLQSTPTVDPDGMTVYCALFPEMPETAFWSRTPGPVAWPTIGGERVPDQAGSYPWVVICEQQTGRTYNYCETTIAQATYQGDGPINES
jgi:hypothetical protein